MGDTTIEWTEKTWNPTRGCELVSPGCTNCYAMKFAHRFSGEGKPFEGLTRLRKNGGPVWTGEWFKPDNDLLSFIEGLRFAQGNRYAREDDVEAIVAPPPREPPAVEIESAQRELSVPDQEATLAAAAAALEAIRKEPEADAPFIPRRR